MKFIWTTIKIQSKYQCEPFPDEQHIFMSQLKGFITTDESITLHDFMNFWCVLLLLLFC
jgi:hypothetical protein